MRKLGEVEIEAQVFEGDELEARKWEIAENLHRSDLTVQERADQIVEWVRLVQLKVGHNDPPSGGPQPKDQGVRAAVRELGVDRNEVQRAINIVDALVKAAAIVS